MCHSLVCRLCGAVGLFSINYFRKKTCSSPCTTATCRAQTSAKETADGAPRASRPAGHRHEDTPRHPHSTRVHTVAREVWARDRQHTHMTHRHRPTTSSGDVDRPPHAEPGLRHRPIKKRFRHSIRREVAVDTNVRRTPYQPYEPRAASYLLTPGHARTTTAPAGSSLITDQGYLLTYLLTYCPPGVPSLLIPPHSQPRALRHTYCAVQHHVPIDPYAERMPRADCSSNTILVNTPGACLLDPPTRSPNAAFAWRCSA